MQKANGLLVMDVDSTLIMEEGIDLLGQATGQGERIAAITAAAMRGDLDFEAALRERVGLLAGLSQEVLAQVEAQIHLTPGAKDLIQAAKSKGYKVGLVSGGFHEMIDPLAAELGIDYVRANHLEIRDGQLTGQVLGSIVTKETKKAMLETWARENNLELSQTLAIGDGANDLLMIQTAGVGIAFCAKPLVQEAAPYQINQRDLREVLPYL